MASKIKGTFRDEQGNEFYPHCYQEENKIIESLKQQILNQIYPVGAIYMSMVNTNPSSFLGGGNWEAITGKFLIGADGTTYQANTAGGASTVTLTTSHLPAHTHTGTTSSDGKHEHDLAGWRLTANSGSYKVRSKEVISGDGWDNNVMQSTGAHTHTFTTGSTGSGSAFSIMPPYLPVYMWKRVS